MRAILLSLLALALVQPVQAETPEVRARVALSLAFAATPVELPVAPEPVRPVPVKKTCPCSDQCRCDHCDGKGGPCDCSDARKTVQPSPAATYAPPVRQYAPQMFTPSFSARGCSSGG